MSETPWSWAAMAISAGTYLNQPLDFRDVKDSIKIPENVDNRTWDTLIVNDVATISHEVQVKAAIQMEKLSDQSAQTDMTQDPNRHKYAWINVIW